MDLANLEETFDRLAKATGVRWYGHVSRSDNNDALRSSDFEAVGRERGQLKMR